MVIVEVAKTLIHMNPEIRNAPVILLGLLLSGWFLFCLNAIFPVRLRLGLQFLELQFFALGFYTDSSRAFNPLSHY